jgi:predicted nuclease of restriction endonuclease-like (RecB) superfamily
MALIIKEPLQLFEEIRFLIESIKSNAISYVNTQLVVLNWTIGSKISQEILKNQRAEYGHQIVSTLSRQLSAEYGQGFSRPNLFRMLKFAEFYKDFEIVSTLSRQLSWSHFVELLGIEEELKRDFYTEMCCIERWSVRNLRDKIQSMLFERTAISKKPDQLIKQELKSLRETHLLTPDFSLRDPYILDFLGMKDVYSEKDLESAILREIQSFIMELGTDFSFLARQKRITIDGDDYYIDLLFYHRNLRRLIAIEIKLGKFKTAYKSQMELYLRWLDKYERKDFEEPPLGIILCSQKKHEAIELLELDKSGIHVAEYLTQFPPLELFKKRLNQAIKAAKTKHDTLCFQEEEREE